MQEDPKKKKKSAAIIIHTFAVNPFTVYRIVNNARTIKKNTVSDALLTFFKAL